MDMPDLKELQETEDLWTQIANKVYGEYGAIHAASVKPSTFLRSILIALEEAEKTQNP